eukprot:3532975-Prymnesium_polylepis.1
MELAMSQALFQAIREKAADPVARIGEILLSSKSSAGVADAVPVAVSAAVPPNTKATSPTEWTLAAWLNSAGNITQ